MPMRAGVVAAEIRHGAAQEIGRRKEIGVEDGDEFAAGGFQPFGQRAGLVAFAIVAMQVADIGAEGLVALDAGAGDLLRLVGGIVEHLDFEFLGRIVEARDGFDQPLDDVALVVDRKLHGDARPLVRIGRRGREIVAELHVGIDQPVAVQAVGGQDGQHGEVRQHDQQVEAVQRIQPAKRIARRVGHLRPVFAERVAGLGGGEDYEIVDV